MTVIFTYINTKVIISNLHIKNSHLLLNKILQVSFDKTYLQYSLLFATSHIKPQYKILNLLN